MKQFLTGSLLLLFLISCGGGKAVFICDQIYAETTVEPCRLNRSLRQSVKKAGYGYGYIETPVTVVLSEVIPESPAVIILSPFLSKQAEACAADRPEVLFVVLEQKPETRLPNLKGLPRNGETAYGELGTLFGRLSRESIPDPFAESEEETGTGVSDTDGNDGAVRNPDDSLAEATTGNAAVSDDAEADFPGEWEPDDVSGNPLTVQLKPAIVFANLSTEKEKNYLAFVNAFAAVNAHASSDLVSLEFPSARDTSSLNRLSDELTSRRCNLVFLDAASMTRQLIETLSGEQMLLVVFPGPPTESALWKNVDMVLEWDYASAFDSFFTAAAGGEEKEIFLELKIKKYKKDSILYPYYAEKIIDK